jgi:hypothetical protein
LRADWHPRDQVIRVTRGRYVGCDELLPGMLPQGTRLPVHLGDEQGTRLLKIHEGTGEGIA